MPQATDIVLNDGTLARTYGPQSNGQGAAALFLNRESGQPNLFDTLTLDQRRNNNGTSVGKLHLSVNKEATDADTGLKYSVGKANVDVKYSFPDTFTAADRTIVDELVKTAIANSVVHAVMVDLETVF